MTSFIYILALLYCGDVFWLQRLLQECASNPQDMVMNQTFLILVPIDIISIVRDKDDAPTRNTINAVLLLLVMPPPPFSNSSYGSVRLSDKKLVANKDALIVFLNHSQSYDVSMYQQLRILFWFIGDEDDGFDGDEYFVLECSPNDDNSETDSLTEIKRWVRGSPEFYRNGFGYTPPSPSPTSSPSPAPSSLPF
jgi:hypothetical protein